jgi:hypothetical protein
MFLGSIAIDANKLNDQDGMNVGHVKNVENSGMGSSTLVWDLNHESGKPQQVMRIEMGNYTKSNQVTCLVWVFTEKGTLRGSHKTRGCNYSKRDGAFEGALINAGLRVLGIGYKESTLQDLGRHLSNNIKSNILVSTVHSS